MMPKGGTGSGSAVIKRGPGGLSLVEVEDYHSHGGLSAFNEWAGGFHQPTSSQSQPTPNLPF